MFEFEKLCHTYENMTYEQRRDELSELSKNIIPALMLLPNGLEAFKILVRAACAADGELQASEYTLVAAATGLDIGYENAENIVKNTDPKALKELADIIVDVFGSLDLNIKADMVSFMLCIVSADNRITLRESMFIQKLLK
ncbi:hypothetical protein SAMN02910456_00870 [Ruminococcaceae bacterium YRB3002]|nr:hypothetical protein SAMN02910456_00870 [Ruminococcaceae bacterium YRB3002]